MKFLIPCLSLLFSLAASVPAAVIYLDDFSGGGGGLNGTAPDFAPGAETWNSSGLWADDGVKASSGHGSAWLPFTPVAGNIYELSATMDPTISGSSDWMAIGFSPTGGTGNFLSQSPTAWVLNRMDDTSTSASQTFMGPGTTVVLNHDYSPDKVGPIDFAVRLDTRFANWSVEWYADGALIRNSLNTFGTNPTINHVGFAGYNTTTGTIDNFQLRTVQRALPEPSTAALWLTGLAMYSGLRRRKSSIDD